MREMKKVSMKDFLAQFDPVVHDAIIQNRNKEGVTGIAALRCEVMDSSRFGQLTALIYGPTCTFKTIEDMNVPHGVYITGLPSSAAFVVNYTDETFKKED